MAIITFVHFATLDRPELKELRLYYWYSCRRTGSRR